MSEEAREKCAGRAAHRRRKGKKVKDALGFGLLQISAVCWLFT